MEPTSVIGTKNKKGQVITDPAMMMRTLLARRRFLPAAKSLRKPSNAPTSM